MKLLLAALSVIIITLTVVPMAHAQLFAEFCAAVQRGIATGPQAGECGSPTTQSTTPSTSSSTSGGTTPQQQLTCPTGYTLNPSDNLCFPSSSSTTTPSTPGSSTTAGPTQVQCQPGEVVDSIGQCVQSGQPLFIGSEQTACPQNTVLEGSQCVPVQSSGLIATATANPTTASGGSVVQLIGTSSVSGATFSWVQTSGPQVTLSNNNQPTTSFTAPITTTATTLQFSLTVSANGQTSQPATVSVVIEPSASTSSGTTGGHVTTSPSTTGGTTGATTTPSTGGTTTPPSTGGGTTGTTNPPATIPPSSNGGTTGGGQTTVTNQTNWSGNAPAPPTGNSTYTPPSTTGTNQTVLPDGSCQGPIPTIEVPCGG